MDIREEEKAKPIEIPMESLSQEALFGVIESFILREGTDYGLHELSLEEKIKNIQSQMVRREIRLIFDLSTESLTFVSKQEWARMQK